MTRAFDGEYKVEFPQHKRETTIKQNWLANELKRCAKEVDTGKALVSEKELQEKLIAGLGEIVKSLPESEAVNVSQLKRVHANVKRLVPRRPKRTSKIVPPVEKLSQEIGGKIKRCDAPIPGEQDEARERVVKALPPFVYYSHYGNLDTEIYLPHVVQNLKRDDLGTREAAKARTLRVLFTFVRLNADEILELGRDFQDRNGEGQIPTEQQIENIGENKRTRSILLQSASAGLTEKFREWWKQGDYRFRFEADGNHFRIWVADDRPTDRSRTGEP